MNGPQATGLAELEGKLRGGGGPAGGGLPGRPGSGALLARPFLPRALRLSPLLWAQDEGAAGAC